MEEKNVTWGNRGEEEFERLNKITPRVLGGFEKQPLMVDAARKSENQKMAAIETLLNIDPEVRNEGIRKSEKHKKACSENMKKNRENVLNSDGWKEYKNSEQFKKMQIENGVKSGEILKQRSLEKQKLVYELLPDVFTLSEAKKILEDYPTMTVRKYLMNTDLYEKVGHGKYRKNNYE